MINISGILFGCFFQKQWISQRITQALPSIWDFNISGKNSPGDTSATTGMNTLWVLPHQKKLLAAKNINMAKISFSEALSFTYKTF